MAAENYIRLCCFNGKEGESAGHQRSEEKDELYEGMKGAKWLEKGEADSSIGVPFISE